MRPITRAVLLAMGITATGTLPRRTKNPTPLHFLLSSARGIPGQRLGAGAVAVLRVCEASRPAARRSTHGMALIFCTRNRDAPAEHRNGIGPNPRARSSIGLRRRSASHRVVRRVLARHPGGSRVVPSHTAAAVSTTTTMAPRVCRFGRRSSARQYHSTLVTHTRANVAFTRRHNRIYRPLAGDQVLATDSFATRTT